MSNKKGFTILEVTVAAVIFALAVAGLFASVTMIQKKGAYSAGKGSLEHITERKLQAAYIAKQILEELRTKVDQRSWSDSSGPFALGVHANAYTSPPINGITYTADYTVSTDATWAEAKKVAVTVRWTEP